MLRFAVALAALLLTSAAARAEGIDKDQLTKIDAAVETALKRNDCPGAVVLVVHDDQIVFVKGQRADPLRPRDVLPA